MGNGAEAARPPEPIEREIPVGKEQAAEKDAAVEPAAEQEELTHSWEDGRFVCRWCKMTAVEIVSTGEYQCSHRPSPSRSSKASE